ncbi:MAG: hypothetical protein ACLVJ6_04755 [Merdibacter sp.]
MKSDNCVQEWCCVRACRLNALDGVLPVDLRQTAAIETRPRRVILNSSRAVTDAGYDVVSLD